MPTRPMTEQEYLQYLKTRNQIIQQRRRIAMANRPRYASRGRSRKVITSQQARAASAGYRRLGKSANSFFKGASTFGGGLFGLGKKAYSRAKKNRARTGSFFRNSIYSKKNTGSNVNIPRYRG